MLLTAPVECGKYFQADRGTLTLADGQLRFETGGRRLFDVPLSSIQIVWHWYSFSGAFEATIGGQSYFLSFVPRGASLNVWYAGMSAGHRWRAAMEGKPASTRAPSAARAFLVFFRLARIFILVCAALLSLSIAMDPTSSKVNRALAGAVAAVATLALIAAIGQGIIAIGVAIRRQSGPNKR